MTHSRVTWLLAVAGLVICGVVSAAEESGERRPSPEERSINTTMSAEEMRPAPEAPHNKNSSLPVVGKKGASSHRTNGSMDASPRVSARSRNSRTLYDSSQDGKFMPTLFNYISKFDFKGALRYIGRTLLDGFNEDNIIKLIREGVTFALLSPFGYIIMEAVKALVMLSIQQIPKFLIWAKSYVM